jgi:hypothetical protein
MTSFWNNLHQVGSEPKCLKVKLFKIWESKKTKGPKQNSGRSTLVLIIITWFRIWKFQEKIYVINHVSAEASNTQRTNIYIYHSYYSTCTHFYWSFGNFYFDLSEWYGLYQLTDSDTENYRSVWHQTHYDISSSHQISACPIKLAVILVIMSVSTFKTVVILYIFKYIQK